MGIIPEVKIEEENDLLYLVIKVDEYPMPISYQGKFYLRSGSNNHEVTGSELDKFMLDRVGKRWEDLPVKNATFDDLSEEAFKVFREKSVKSGRLKLEDVESIISSMKKIIQFKLVSMMIKCMYGMMVNFLMKLLNRIYLKNTIQNHIIH